MDISKASNFERYVFDALQRDAKRMNELWGALKKDGSFTLAKEEEARVAQSGFVAGSSTHADRLTTIRLIFEKYNILVDPHTADGVTTGSKYREQGIPLICLETAQPAKFSNTIIGAIGKEPEAPESFKRLAELPERYKEIEADAEAVQRYIASHA
jgi:threonine synthase